MKKVLICVLDWGLGHATRMVPVIRLLKQKQAEVHIGSSGSALALLRLEFPDDVFIELPPYNPHYSRRALAFSLGLQIPGFLRVIRDEHAMVRSYCEAQQIDIIISDNRYGCRADQRQSVLITHQPSVILPDGYRWLEKPVNGKLRNWIDQFDSVWIPDQPGSGLTEPFVTGWDGTPEYIGWLSRFQIIPGIERAYGLLALVSGPEPGRLQLEKLLTKELTKSEMKSILVTGQPGPKSIEQVGKVEKINHLPAEQLSALIQSSGMIIARSGYSTIMDLITLGKQAIFIPTPQQPEQRWMADCLMKMGVVFSMAEKKFNLAHALQETLAFRGLGELKRRDDLLGPALDKLLNL